MNYRKLVTINDLNMKSSYITFMRKQDDTNQVFKNIWDHDTETDHVVYIDSQTRKRSISSNTMNL